MDVNEISVLKYWCRHTSNHGLPKIFSSKFSFIWTIFFLMIGIYCALLILIDVYKYVGSDVNTKVTIVNPILSQLPTVSVCADSMFMNSTEFNLSLIDCETKRSKYLEVEKCFEFNFIKRMNGCLTLNISSLSVTGDSSDVGLKLKFKTSELDTTGLFVIVHEMNIILSSPANNREYINLFMCESRNESTQVIYSVMKQRRSIKLPKLANNCIQTNDADYNQNTCFSECLKTSNKSNQCTQMCPAKCVTDSYSISKTVLCDLDVYEQGVSSVNINFKDNKLAVIEEVEAMKLTQLTGYIG